MPALFIGPSDVTPVVDLFRRQSQKDLDVKLTETRMPVSLSALQKKIARQRCDHFLLPVHETGRWSCLYICGLLSRCPEGTPWRPGCGDGRWAWRSFWLSLLVRERRNRSLPWSLPSTDWRTMWRGGTQRWRRSCRRWRTWTSTTSSWHGTRTSTSLSSARWSRPLTRRAWRWVPRRVPTSPQSRDGPTVASWLWPMPTHARTSPTAKDRTRLAPRSRTLVTGSWSSVRRAWTLPWRMWRSTSARTRSTHTWPFKTQTYCRNCFICRRCLTAHFQPLSIEPGKGPLLVRRAMTDTTSLALATSSFRREHASPFSVTRLFLGWENVCPMGRTLTHLAAIIPFETAQPMTSFTQNMTPFH